MRYITLLKISANSSHIWWRKGPETPPKKGHFMDATWPQKHLKISNLTTINATLMKLTKIMYFHKTLNLVEDWVVTHRV